MKFGDFSVYWSDQWSEEAEAAGERADADADQDPPHHHSQDSLWWRVQDLGQVPDESPQEGDWSS